MTTELGVVDGVTVDEDTGLVWVRVFRGPGRESLKAPFFTPMSGMWIIPEQKQIVEIEEVAPGRRVARFPETPPDYSMPSGLGEGDFALKTDSGTSIVVTADGDIDINASGNVTIDGIDFDEHVHEYQDDNGTSTTTKTTDVPQ